MHFTEHARALAASQANGLAMLQTATRSNVDIVRHLVGNVASKKEDIAAATEQAFTRRSSIEVTAAYLREEGFEDYADHFLAKRMNGRALLQISESYLAEMPEQSLPMRAGFLELIAELKAAQR
jgi:hypothetical protein